ncbi:MAG: hypothetical protein ABL986_17095 [Vicinamibacterales bacterium]
MGEVEFGWGRTSKSSGDTSQYELRTSWEVGETSSHFHRLFRTSLLGFVGHVVTVFSPPASIGLLFQFGPGMREEFIKLVDARAFPAKTLDAASWGKSPAPSVMIPDNPGPGHRDAWWRTAAAGAAIGASFREEGTDTSVHIAFNSHLCDVHVDRNGFVVNREGYPRWDLNNLLRHFTVDLAGDKVPWLLGSMTVLNRRNRPIFQATLSPWLAVDLPSREGPDKTAVKVGLALTGVF